MSADLKRLGPQQRLALRQLAYHTLSQLTFGVNIPWRDGGWVRLTHRWKILGGLEERGLVETRDYRDGPTYHHGWQARLTHEAVRALAKGKFEEP